MSEDPPDGGASGGGPRDHHDAHHHHDIGSVSEEAAKLIGALGDWAKDQGSSYAGAAAAGAAGMGEALRDVDRHLATGAEECRYCPICLLVAKVRATSPEVRQHLSSATTSLLAAVAGMLATPVPDSDRRGPVERIDLGADPGPEEQSGGRRAEEPSGGDVPWWASPGAQPHDAASDRAAPGAAPDDPEASATYAEDFEDLAADRPRARRTRRPCTEEEEPR